jgi:hypothetical protein
MNRRSLIAGALKRVGTARRKAQPPKPRANDAATIEYLYVPCVRACDGVSAETCRWVQEVPIVKKTAKLIYYTSDSWNWRDAAVSPGCISREQFEADTRCHWEDRCHHGYPAGVIPIPGDRHRAGPAGRFFFATRQAAEGDLYRGEREQAGLEAQLFKELCRAMADAHPGHGGTASSSSRCDARTRLRFGKRDDSGGLAMTRRQRNNAVEARADLILAEEASLEAYVAYFETQMRRGTARRRRDW